MDNSFNRKDYFARNSWFKQNFNTQSIIQMTIIVITLIGLTWAYKAKVDNHEIRLCETETRVQTIDVKLARIDERVGMIYDAVRNK